MLLKKKKKDVTFDLRKESAQHRPLPAFLPIPSTPTARTVREEKAKPAWGPSSLPCSMEAVLSPGRDIDAPGC